LNDETVYKDIVVRFPAVSRSLSM